MLSLYRKNCVYNFEPVAPSDKGDGGVMVSALPTTPDGKYDTSKKVLFFCGINDILMIGNIFAAKEPKEIKLIHKPDGDFKNPISKTLVFNLKNPNLCHINLSMSNKDDNVSISIPGTSFDAGTLWALEHLFKQGLSNAMIPNYKRKAQSDAPNF